MIELGPEQQSADFLTQTIRKAPSKCWSGRSHTRKERKDPIPPESPEEVPQWRKAFCPAYDISHDLPGNTSRIAGISILAPGSGSVHQARSAKMAIHTLHLQGPRLERACVGSTMWQVWFVEFHAIFLGCFSEEDAGEISTFYGQTLKHRHIWRVPK